jgi:hypothetical protein
LQKSLQVDIFRLSYYEKEKNVMGDEDEGKMDKYASERKRKRKKVESWL